MQLVALEHEQLIAFTVVDFTVGVHLYGVAEKNPEVIVNAQEVVDLFPIDATPPVWLVIEEEASQLNSPLMLLTPLVPE
mgnify:CR=1 FL=1